MVPPMHRLPKPRALRVEQLIVYQPLLEAPHDGRRGRGSKVRARQRHARRKASALPASALPMNWAVGCRKKVWMASLRVAGTLKSTRSRSRCAMSGWCNATSAMLVIGRPVLSRMPRSTSYSASNPAGEARAVVPGKGCGDGNRGLGPCSSAKHCTVAKMQDPGIQSVAVGSRRHSKEPAREKCTFDETQSNPKQSVSQSVVSRSCPALTPPR